jgi:hypothetical protein
MNADEFMPLSKRTHSLLWLLLFLPATLSASTLTGTVKNGTTGKASIGDDVILLKLVGGMEEESRTRSGRDANFALPIEDINAPHVVRVVHQKVTYHAVAKPGVATVGEVAVYDAAPRVQGVSQNEDVMIIQSEGGLLRVTEMYDLSNASTPPHTLMGEKTFEIFLPAGAQMDSAMAASAGGMPVNSAPVPQADPGHYAFVFPLRPGESQFQVEYHLPYSGAADLRPRVSVPTEMLAVMLPQSIQFSPANSESYSVKDQNGVSVRIARNVAPGTTPAFHISGNGALPPDALKNLTGGDSTASEAAVAQTPRPGGGMAVPEGTPDPLDKYRWWFLGGFVLVLAAGAFVITSRQSGATTPTPAVVSASGGRSSMVLEALKEELFQLESERLQQKISTEEYDKAKAALDATLARAMRREKS